MNPSLLSAKSIVERCWSYRWLAFAYFKPFPGLNYMAGPDWSKLFFKPVNTDIACEALWQLAILRYGGIWSKICKHGHRLFGVPTEVFWGRQVCI